MTRPQLGQFGHSICPATTALETVHNYYGWMMHTTYQSIQLCIVGQQRSLLLLQQLHESVHISRETVRLVTVRRRSIWTTRRGLVVVWWWGGWWCGHVALCGLLAFLQHEGEQREQGMPINREKKRINKKLNSLDIFYGRSYTVIYGIRLSDLLGYSNSIL